VASLEAANSALSARASPLHTAAANRRGNPSKKQRHCRGVGGWLYSRRALIAGPVARHPAQQLPDLRPGLVIACHQRTGNIDRVRLYS
jgi:hypothetical protein